MGQEAELSAAPGSPILPALSLLGQAARGCPAAGPCGATALLSHAVLGGVAARGPCGESGAALAREMGRGGGAGVVLDSAALLLAPAQSPTSPGPEDSHSALTPEHPRRPPRSCRREAHRTSWPQRTLSSWAQVWTVSGVKGRVHAQRARGEEPGSQWTFLAGSDRA